MEVYESRGMQVCEEALKVLRVSWPFAPLIINTVPFLFQSVTVGGEKHFD